MKLFNKSSKVISVGSTVLMPDAEMTITKAEANLPSIQCFVKCGFLVIIGDETKRAKAENEPTAALNTEEGNNTPTEPKTEKKAATKAKEDK